jgi:hypothetical protein
VDEMAGTSTVGRPESENRRANLLVHSNDLGCYLAFVKRVEPTPDLLDPSFPEKIVYMPEPFFLFPQMPGQSSSEISFGSADVEIETRLEFSFRELARFELAGFIHF